VGNVLQIEGKRGSLIEIIPGNKKAWFRWTYKRDGRDASSFPRGWSTEDDFALETKFPGGTRTMPEAFGITQKLKKDTNLSTGQIQKLESWFIHHDNFQGFKFGS
jgi:hypothetical protein